MDQDECRVLVLNLETAFPKVYGDPRGLFTVLCGSTASSTPSGQTPGSTSGSSGNNGTNASTSSGGGTGGGGGSTAVHSVLGLVPGHPSSMSEMIGDCMAKDEIAEAVAVALKSSNTSVAKVSNHFFHFNTSTSRVLFCDNPGIHVNIAIEKSLFDSSYLTHN